LPVIWRYSPGESGAGLTTNAWSNNSAVSPKL